MSMLTGLCYVQSHIVDNLLFCSLDPIYWVVGSPVFECLLLNDAFLNDAFLFDALTCSGREDDLSCRYGVKPPPTDSLLFIRISYNLCTKMCYVDVLSNLPVARDVIKDRYLIKDRDEYQNGLW